MIIFIEGPDEEGKRLIYDAAKKEFASEAYFCECVYSAINEDNNSSTSEQMTNAFGRISMAINLANDQISPMHLFVLNGPMHAAVEFEKVGDRAASLTSRLIRDDRFDHVYVAMVMRSPKSNGAPAGYGIVEKSYRELIKNNLSAITSARKSNTYKFVISGNANADYVADFISGIRNVTRPKK